MSEIDFAKLSRKIREVKKWNRQHMGSQFELSDKAVAGWENGNTVPHSKKKKELCEYAVKLGLAIPRIPDFDEEKTVLSLEEVIHLSQEEKEESERTFSKIKFIIDRHSEKTNLAAMIAAWDVLLRRLKKQNISKEDARISCMDALEVRFKAVFG